MSRVKTDGSIHGEGEGVFQLEGEYGHMRGMGVGKI